MKRLGTIQGFTLVEMLVGTLVLALIVLLASQMTSATLSTVSHSSFLLDSSEGVRTATQMLRDELSAVIASERPERFLNLQLTDGPQGVALYFTVPRAHTADLTRMGFVTHVAYVWDREARTLGRAEYDSAREPESVSATASSPDSTDSAANLARLRDITPAYQGSMPYEWITQPFWEERLKQARRNPLLTGVAEWKVECFKTAAFDAEVSGQSTWMNPGGLPAALRFTFVIDQQRRQSRHQELIGRRYVSIVPLPGAEAAP